MKKGGDDDKKAEVTVIMTKMKVMMVMKHMIAIKGEANGYDKRR